MGKDRRRRQSRKDEQENIDREERLLEQVGDYKRSERLVTPPPGHFHNTARRQRRRKTTREYLTDAGV